MKGFQPYAFPLRNPSYSAGGQDTVSMETLPNTIFNRIAHVAGFLLDIVLTPTYTTAPTINGIMSVINNLTFFDGSSERINLSGQLIRAQNIHWFGKSPVPEPDTNSGSGNQIRFLLPIFFGPPTLAGSPTDFILPAAALKSGELRFKFGALTDYSADTTNIASVNIRCTAILVPLDSQFRVPPVLERRAFNFGTNEALLQGKALYTHVAILKQSLAVFANGDLGDVTIDTGIGSVPSLVASSLTGIAQMATQAGLITQLRGEPRFATTDDNEKTVNLGTPTALVASDAYLQSVITCQENARISKLLFEATSAMRIKYSGTLTTPTMLVSRILEQNETAQAALAAKAVAELNMGSPRESRIKGLDGRDYKGPRSNYLPRVFKF